MPGILSGQQQDTGHAQGKRPERDSGAALTNAAALAPQGPASPCTPGEHHPWSSMKSGLGNLSVTTLDQFAAAIRSRLARIQRQPALIAGLLGQTGLTLETSRPSRQTSGFQPVGGSVDIPTS